VGVELEAPTTKPTPIGNTHAWRKFSRFCAGDYPIVDVVGHADIAPGRKTDPGRRFDWGIFRESLARIQ